MHVVCVDAHEEKAHLRVEHAVTFLQGHNVVAQVMASFLPVFDETIKKLEIRYLVLLQRLLFELQSWAF